MLKASLLKSLKTAISNVLETMFFQPAQVKEGPGELADWLPRDQSLIGARLGFGGPESGICYLLIPSEGITQMTANFLGIDESDVKKEQVTDTVKEMLNMIGGYMLSLSDKTGAFQLGIPELLDENENVQEKLERSNGDIILVETDQTRMAVSLIVI